MGRRVVAVLLVLAGCAAAQPAGKRRPAKPKIAAPEATPAAPKAWPIGSLAVTGNRNYSEEQILAAAQLKPGAQATREVFEAARDRLLATGVFESVGYRFDPAPDGKSYAAKFDVVEVAPVYPMRFEDLPAGGAELEAALRRGDPLFGEKIPATKELLYRYIGRLQSFLATKNYTEKVAARLVADAPGQLVVLFRPAASPPSVAEVRFTGNSVIPATALQNAIAGVAVGVVYSEKRFRQLLDTSVRPLYDARGRIRVSFPKIEALPAADVKGLIVRVEVAEGDSYSLGDVRVEASGVDTAELSKAGNFKTGDVANFDEVAAGRNRILKQMRANGYMQARATLDRKVNDARKTVDVTVRLDPGPRYLFGKLNLVGLDINSEPVIKRLWAMKEGSPFNADYPEYFLNRVREDGVFDNLGKTKSAIKIDEQARTADVTLYFSGDKPAEPRKQ